MRQKEDDPFFPLWDNLMESMYPMSREERDRLWDVDRENARLGDKPKTRDNEWKED